MKKLIFILTVLVWSGVLILLSFSRENPSGKNDAIAIDFSEGEKLYGWDMGKKAFIETDPAGQKGWANTFYLHRLSPIDGIYYRSGEKKPLLLERKDGTNIVTFGSGLFVCNIQTGLEKYEFRLNDMTLSLKGRGVFLVDTTQKQVKIFSFDAFLNTDMVSGTKRTPISRFTLFPSLLFKHDPGNTLELKEADILRISIIDSIRYVDIKTADDQKMLFSWDNAEKDGAFLGEIQKDITTRINAFVALYTSLREQNDKKIKNVPFFNASNSLLVNGSKKEVLLKNILVENILQLLKNPQKTQYWTQINDTLSEMKGLNQKVYSDGLSILRQYYYITTFSRFVSTDSLFAFSDQESPLISGTEKIIAGNHLQTKQGEYYIHLSDLFSVYYFLALSQSELNNSFEKILQKILSNKVLTKDEFLPFAFFVTQYLSTGPVILNEDTMLTVSHLFQITNDYYTNHRSDEAKLATITSTTFYNYTRIFTKIYNVCLNTFIDKTPEGLLLKKSYLDGENTNLEQNFVDAFVKVIDRAKKDVENKKAALYSKGSLQSNSQIIDSYTLLKNTLGSFDMITSMFSNYPKYLNDFHLNDSNRSARGILVEKGNEMSMETLGAYLKGFNNLDISSLRVANNFVKDGFYEIQVNILWRIFYFKLWEQNHIIADISYADTLWKKHAFPNITIPLDGKEEQLKELFASSSDPVLQYKYDFRNFFETTFLKGDLVATTSTETPATPSKNVSSATPEIQLFIQKELLDKDFKNIESFLPIKFKNITASISEGNYMIDLTDIDTTFAGENSTYPVKLSSKYIFNRHSFSRLLFKVKKEGDMEWYEFGGATIEVLPARISLLSLPESLKDLGYYMDTIRSSYRNQQSIVIDTIGKRVLLDNVPAIPKFPTP